MSPTISSYPLNPHHQTNAMEPKPKHSCPYESCVADNQQLPQKSPPSQKCTKDAEKACRGARRAWRNKIPKNARETAAWAGRGTEHDRMLEKCSTKLTGAFLGQFPGAGGQNRRIGPVLSELDQIWSPECVVLCLRPWETGAKTRPRARFDHLFGFCATALFRHARRAPRSQHIFGALLARWGFEAKLPASFQNWCRARPRLAGVAGPTSVRIGPKVV